MPAMAGFNSVWLCVQLRACVVSLNSWTHKRVIMSMSSLNCEVVGGSI